MSLPATPVEPLAPELEARFLDFAKTCRSAASMVSLYPSGHPAIRAALARLVSASMSATKTGTMQLTVLPDRLVVNGAQPSRADRAVSELADLLHRHAIGGFVLHGGADPESWRAMLLLLARAPEEIRDEGGIGQLWSKSGGPSIEIQEIDFGEVLRERQGGEIAELAEVIAHALKAGSRPSLAGQALQTLARLLRQPDGIRALWEQVRMTQVGASHATVAKAFLELSRTIVGVSAKSNPDDLPGLFEKLGGEAGQLPPEALQHLLTHHGQPGALMGSVDVVEALAQHIDDATAATTVARAVAEQASVELVARVVQALLPSSARRLRVLDEAKAETTAKHGDDGRIDERWRSLEQTLSTPLDTASVPADYARELGTAISLEIDRLDSDPQERIETWLGSVSDTALRALDIQLLVDLLEVELDTFRWRDNLTTVRTQIEHLMVVGHHESAVRLAEGIAVHAADTERGRRPHALEALEALRKGPVLRQAITLIRTADDEGFSLMQRLCHALGPTAIAPLVDALAGDQTGRAQRRLQEVILGFGDRAREVVEHLLNSTNWEVRRTATLLFRELGGGAIPSNLEALLNDAEPLVQREALRTIALVGDDAAYELLVQTLVRASSHVRDLLVRELDALRDERAAPLMAHLVRELPGHRSLTGLYLTAIERVAVLGGPSAVPVLSGALYHGEWWAPFRTRVARRAAAAALQRLDTTAAHDALQQAVLRGTRGVRSVAREYCSVGEPRGAATEGGHHV